MWRACRQTQELLGHDVKLPVMPDPLESFLAAVGRAGGTAVRGGAGA